MASSVLGTRAAATVGGHRLPPRDARTSMHCVEPPAAEHLPKAGPGAQRLAQAVYVGFLRARLALTGRGFRAHVAGYTARGMDFRHDVHDWLGGYPYETMSAAAVEALMVAQDLEKVRELAVSRSARPLGLFGSGCDEYVYRRAP